MSGLWVSVSISAIPETQKLFQFSGVFAEVFVGIPDCPIEILALLGVQEHQSGGDASMNLVGL